MLNDTLLKKLLSFVLNIYPMFNALGSLKLIFLKKKEGKKLIGNKIETISRDEWDLVHLYVLHNDNEFEPCVEMHRMYSEVRIRIEMKIG